MAAAPATVLRPTIRQAPKRTADYLRLLLLGAIWGASFLFLRMGALGWCWANPSLRPARRRWRHCASPWRGLSAPAVLSSC